MCVHVSLQVFVGVHMHPAETIKVSLGHWEVHGEG